MNLQALRVACGINVMSQTILHSFINNMASYVIKLILFPREIATHVLLLIASSNFTL